MSNSGHYDEIVVGVAVLRRMVATVGLDGSIRRCQLRHDLEEAFKKKIKTAQEERDFEAKEEQILG